DLLACPPEDRLDERYRGSILHGERSGAPVGESFEFPVDRNTQKRKRARFWQALRDIGYVPGERVMLVSDDEVSVGASLLRWTRIDTSLGDEAILASYSSIRPAVFCAPLGILSRLAARLTASAEQAWRPRLIVSTAEHLTDAKRALLESTFRAKVA